MVLTNARIVTPNSIIENGSLKVENGIIQEISEQALKGNDVIDCHGAIIMPGYIDIHVHGSCGVDFMDATKDDYRKLSQAFYEEGVTTFLATTLTAGKEQLEYVCRQVKEAMPVVPNLGGIQLEGPYINEKYKGAQNADYIRNPDIEELKKLCELSGGAVKYIALAPEKEGAFEFIREARKLGVHVSAGHTDATFDCIEEARKYGLTNTTHTHNAMSGHHHRNPGTLTAAFYFDDLFTELICDGIHVCSNVVKTFYKIVGSERLILITDALKVKHSDLQEFDLFGLPCEMVNGSAHLKMPDGSVGPLSGSCLTFDQGVRNFKQFTSCDLISLAKCSSTNAARSLEFTDRGSIEIGKLADLLILNDNLQILNVYKKGIKVK